MKHPMNSIAWHEQNLLPRYQYAHRLYEELLSKERQLKELREENAFLEKQIAEAKKRGKATFDADKFLRKRSSK